MGRARAGVVLVEDGRVVLIERHRDGLRYFVCPGGGVEAGESFEDAAAREAREELGLEVELDGRQVYFRARVVGGELGTRIFDEEKDAGTYRPARVALDELAALDVRPPELKDYLARATTRSRPRSG